MEQKKVMLMYPNFSWLKGVGYTNWLVHPYNLCLLASMIREEVDIKIVDANIDNLSKEDFLKILEEYNPDILGISIITNEYAETGIITSEIAKKYNPNIITIMGGVSAISNPGYYIKNHDIDYLINGEGEYVFRDLIKFIKCEGNLPEKGIFYKEDGAIINKGKADLIEDLDRLPFPSYDLVDFNKYVNKIQRESTDRPRALPYTRIRTSRGCPFNCCFCEVPSISGKKPRYRSLQNIAKEIEYFIENYGIKSITFDDDNLIVNKERAKELFKMMIDKKYNLKWQAPGLAVYMLDDELINLMKESGCTYINIAIESGNQEVLDNIINKPLNLEKTKEVIKKLKKSGIDLAANFIIGFPGETWTQIRETLKFAEDIEVDYVKIYIATPFPNTELFHMAKEKGYLRNDYEINKHLWTDGWINSNEFTHQDLKYLRAYEWDRINFTDPRKKKKIAEIMDITEERLDEIRRETLNRINK